MPMMELESMAVAMPEVEGHPNRAEFRGVLTVVDVASERAPSGAKGHRVVLTRTAAEAALPSLLGMALDYAPSFDRHDQRRKVGVITSAEVVGRNLEVGGHLYAKDFPEVVKEIGKWGGKLARSGDRTEAPTSGKTGERWGTPVKSWDIRAGAVERMRVELAAAVGRLREMTAGMRSRRVSSFEASTEMAAGGAAGLGMSFEVADVVLADKRSRVWILTKVMFTGAAVLRRDKAAYESTWIELA
jgi:hypothetical protein